MKLLLLLILSILGLAVCEDITICDCSGTCDGSCQTYPLDNCTQELNLCNGSPVASSYIQVSKSLGSLYRIRFYDDIGCTNELDNARNSCDQCDDYPFSYPALGFRAIVQCPGGGGPGTCEGAVVVYDDQQCGDVGLCDDGQTLSENGCQTLLVDDQEFSAMFNCTTNTTTLYTSDDCTGQVVNDDCADLGDYSVRVFYSNECPSDGDGSSDGDGDAGATLFAFSLLGWTF